MKNNYYLEQVHDGHGGVAEPVHKDRLQKPLSIVQRPRNDDNVIQFNTELHRPGSGSYVGGGGEGRAVGVQGPVGEPGSGVEPQIDEHRPRVLAEEHRGPAYLQAAVLPREYHHEHCQENRIVL